jgi:hypothetical protein
MPAHGRALPLSAAHFGSNVGSIIQLSDCSASPDGGTGKPAKQERACINQPPAVRVFAGATGDGTSLPQHGQYFEGMPSEAWSFRIGGYQVCEKWLKERCGCPLSYDDLEHYCKVVTALNETIRLVAEIHAAIGGDL